MKKNTLIIMVAVILVLAAGGYFGYKKYVKTQQNKQRQAVFLTNGQVYFGFIRNQDDQFIKLENIYYLKSTDNLQQNDATVDKKKLSLVKLGDEVHGPTDMMYINVKNVLYWETMRADSKINSVINKYETEDNM